MKKDFVTVTPDTGSGDKALSFVADANSGNARETSISIAGGGISKSVAVNQVAGSLLNHSIDFIMNGVIYKGTMTKDQFLLDRRELTLTIETIVRAGIQTDVSYGGRVGVMKIDNSTAINDRLPIFEQCKYSESVDIFDIEVDDKLTTKIYKPIDDNERDDFNLLMKAFLLEGGTDGKLILSTKDKSCTLSIQLTANIQAIDFGTYVFVGIAGGSTRVFAFNGKSHFIDLRTIGIKEENSNSFGQLRTMRFTGYDDFTINSRPNAFNDLLTLYTVEDSTIQENFLKICESIGKGSNIRAIIQFTNKQESINFVTNHAF